MVTLGAEEPPSVNLTLSIPGRYHERGRRKNVGRMTGEDQYSKARW